MKQGKHIFYSLFFLFSFLASFSLSAYNTLSSNNPSSKNNKTNYFISCEENLSSENDVFFEKNENENECFSFIVSLQYFATKFFSKTTRLICFVPQKQITETVFTPIYISVHNFRI